LKHYIGCLSEAKAVCTCQEFLLMYNMGFVPSKVDLAQAIKTTKATRKGWRGLCILQVEFT